MAESQRTGVDWTGFDWNTMNRLDERGLISEPVRNAKSVRLSDDDMVEGERLFGKLLCRL